MRFKIKHGLYLNSARKLLGPNTFYVTESQEEADELLTVFGEAVEQILPEAPKAEEKPSEKPVDPSDDITLAKGVGAALAKKLAEKGVTTYSGLKTYMSTEEAKEVLGTSYEKVAKNFEEPTPAE